jgi:hypothetical protein
MAHLGTDFGEALVLSRGKVRLGWLSEHFTCLVSKCTGDEFFQKREAVVSTVGDVRNTNSV